MSYFIDGHCHLHPSYFEDQMIPSILIQAKAVNVLKVVSCASDPNYFTNVMDSYVPNELFVTLGIQPTESEHHINPSSIQNALDNYTQIQIKERLKAIGEIGLDYYWIKDDQLRQRQETLFKSTIQFASQLDLPIVTHTRKAEEESLNILEKYATTPVLLHSFEGNQELISRAIDLDYLISIPTNVVIRKNRRKVALRVGLDNMVLETDSPYCGPSADHFPNTPASIPIAAQKIAELLNVSLEDVRDATTKNTEKFYGI